MLKADEGRTMVLSYNRSVEEWGAFLQRGVTERLNGEIDCCSWGALGPENFLYRQSFERHLSFTLCNKPEERLPNGGCYFEASSADGTELSLWKVLPSQQVLSCAIVLLKSANLPAGPAKFRFHRAVSALSFIFC